MKELEWILDQTICAIHDEQLAAHGGREGIRDPGLLESALNSPKNMHSYEKPTLFKLAAVYAYRISNNQPFVDGNKRTAYVASRLFLMLNGYDITAPENERVQMFLDISNNIKSEDELAMWFKKWSVAIPD